MTTKLLIINDPDSNPAQHVELALHQGGSAPLVIKLAPGEMFSKWIAGDTRVEAREIFEPKPKA